MAMTAGGFALSKSTGYYEFTLPLPSPFSSWTAPPIQQVYCHGQHDQVRSMSGCERTRKQRDWDVHDSGHVAKLCSTDSKQPGCSHAHGRRARPDKRGVSKTWQLCGLCNQPRRSVCASTLYFPHLRKMGK